MTQDLVALIEAAIASRAARRTGDEIEFLCPAHEDHDPSAGWNRRKGVWKCLSCGAGGSARDLAERLGIHVETVKERAEKGTIVAVYDYRDERGELLYQKVRWQPKSFTLRKADGSPGVGSRWVLYRLPELLASSGRVYVVEGEKDADNLARLGLTVTTAAEGAQGRSKSRPDVPSLQKWKPDYNAHFAGRDVVILPDHDQAGEDFANFVAAGIQPLARSVRVVRLPDLPDKGDVSDWLLNGSRAELEALADAAPEWQPPAEPVGIAAFAHTDSGNAELFAHLWGDRVRFDHRLGRWLVWDRHRWTPEATGELIRLAIAAARARAKAAADMDPDIAKATFSFAKRSENAGAIESALKIAKALEPIADNGEGWDANPLLLGCTNGVVNLTTGTLQCGRHEDRITKTTGIAYDAQAECPRWLAFLEEVFAGDAEIIAFIRRAVGYSLTGLLSEQVWFLLYGSGANGKSTFVDTISAICGDYGADTPADTITGRGIINAGAATPDIAALVGKRVVTCSETEEVAKVSAARVKQLTGGSPVTARPLYKDPITFTPQLHLWLTTNHLPRVDDDSEGFWRRVRLVPFTQTFEGSARDSMLEQKLRAELPGILRWAVEGTVEWRRDGLRPPASVMLATLNYRQASDPIAEFISDCCVVMEGAKATRGQLFDAYKAWGRAQGMTERELLGVRSFGRRIDEKWRNSKGTGGVRWYWGVGLRDNNEPDSGATDPKVAQPLLRSEKTENQPWENASRMGLPETSATSATSATTGCDCDSSHPGEFACDGEMYWTDYDGSEHCPRCHEEPME